MIQREGILIDIKERGGVIVCLVVPKILSPNVRGLNEKDKRMRIRGLIRVWKVDIICLH